MEHPADIWRGVTLISGARSSFVNMRVINVLIVCMVVGTVLSVEDEILDFCSSTPGLGSRGSQHRCRGFCVCPGVNDSRGSILGYVLRVECRVWF